MPPPSTQHAVADALTAPPVDEPLPQAAVTALWQGHVVEAIKLVRLERNIGLKEAKGQVDAYLLRQPVLKKKMEQAQAETWEGLLRWLTFLLIGGIGLAYLLM